MQEHDRYLSCFCARSGPATVHMHAVNLCMCVHVCARVEHELQKKLCLYVHMMLVNSFSVFLEVLRGPWDCKTGTVMARAVVAGATGL